MITQIIYFIIIICQIQRYKILNYFIIFIVISTISQSQDTNLIFVLLIDISYMSAKEVFYMMQLYILYIAHQRVNQKFKTMNNCKRPNVISLIQRALYSFLFRMRSPMQFFIVNFYILNRRTILYIKTEVTTLIRV